MANPHDALFRATFAVPEHAEGLLSALLPPALARAIDWRTLVAQPGSFLDDELRASHGDLLFAARISGQSLLLYVLLEHKSTADRWTALQLLGYVVRIWQRWRREHPEELHLPPVVPVVLHHGGRSWSAPTDMQALLGLGPLDPEIAAEIHDLVPRFRFLLDDLSAQAEPELTDRALSATARLTLLFLQRIRGLPDAEALAAIVRWRDLVVSVAASPSGQLALLSLWSYFLQVTDVAAEELRSVVAKTIDPIIGEAVMSTAERIARAARAEGQAEGRTQGRTEGRTEGRVEGRAEGQLELLLRQLTARFGPLPETVLMKIRQGSDADRGRWAERVLFARTLDEVFAD